jgi:hypothetical protein
VRKQRPVSAPLLILLVGELTAPYKPGLVASLPTVFPGEVPEVALGTQAPPGRNVAWVRQPSKDEVELTLHTAYVSGDLRRTLHFSAADPTNERARTIAFTLSVMAEERKADLAKFAVDSAAPPAPVVEPPSWSLSVRGLGVVGIAGPQLGGGALVEGHRLLPWRLSVGLGVEVAGSAGRTALTQPAAWAAVSLRLGEGVLEPRLSLGGGAVASVSSKGNVTQTLWSPLFRAAVDFTWRFAGRHGLVFGLATHLSSVVPLIMGANGGDVGPMWARLELGYAGEF